MKREEELPWSDVAVFICTKCHKAIAPESLKLEGNAAENLKMNLKRHMQTLGVQRKIRVMTSSCLDVCIDGVQAALMVKANGEQEVMTFHPEEEAESFKQHLLQQLK